MKLLAWVAVGLHLSHAFTIQVSLDYLYAKRIKLKENILKDQHISSEGPTEEEATSYLAWLDQAFCQSGNVEMSARWDYVTDITENHEENMVG